MTVYWAFAGIQMTQTNLSPTPRCCNLTPIVAHKTDNAKLKPMDLLKQDTEGGSDLAEDLVIPGCSLCVQLDPELDADAAVLWFAEVVIAVAAAHRALQFGMFVLGLQLVLVPRLKLGERQPLVQRRH